MPVVGAQVAADCSRLQFLGKSPPPSRRARHNRQRNLERAAGADVAGKMHTARSRNDIAITLYRMTARRKLLALASAVAGLRCAVLERSSMVAHAGAAAGPAAGQFAGKLAMGSAHPGEQPAFLVASLYTASYRPLAERLAASLTQFGLPYALYEVPTVHRSLSVLGTDDPTYTKANFVRHLLDTHRVPILYLDCDCVIRTEPKLIRSFIEAGTITQADRGFLSAATNSSREWVPIAPSLASCSIGPGARL